MEQQTGLAAILRPFPIYPEEEQEKRTAQLEQILETATKFHPTGDLEVIRRAWDVAHALHEGQKRASGDPYVSHAVAVGQLLAELRLDPATIAAGLLHDTLEDTRLTEADLRAQFGSEIAQLVTAVTNVSRIDYTLKGEKHLENLRRMIVATAKDMRVIFIKLCDRLHNMRTLQYLRPEKRSEIANATLNIFCPLAHRLGMGRVKNEMEDLCLMHLHSRMYKDLKSKITRRLQDQQGYAERVLSLLQDHLATHGVRCEVKWRVKHCYSVFRKMQAQQKDLVEIHDLIGLRIITGTITECYAALGLVHEMYRQVQGSFRDYISNPKPNDYRSIHTVVMGPEGYMLEVQIRTQEMDAVCENGVAAHWLYKDRKGSRAKLGDGAKWLQELSAMLQDTDDPEEFTRSLKQELFADEMYVYTPKGDIVRLPAGATAVDLAYHIHTDLGDTCVGARIGERFMPVNYQLQTGEKVEIVTRKNAHPSPDWLNFVKTSRARTKVRYYLLHSEEDNLREMGRRMLTRSLAEAGFQLRQLEESSQLEGILQSLGFQSLDSMLVHIGYGRINPRQVIARLVGVKPSKKHTQRTSSSEGVKLSDMDGIAYRLARCCMPMRGEPIIGVVTQGGGISVHRSDCRNVINYRGDSNRKIDLHWDLHEGDGETHTVLVCVNAQDRQRLLADTAEVISTCSANIVQAHTDARSGTHFPTTLNFTIQVFDINHLQRIMSRLVETEGVRSVTCKRRTDTGDGGAG